MRSTCSVSISHLSNTAPMSMQISASSNDERLKYDVILCSLGTRYNSYCANLGRTLLVDPSKQQEAEYKCGMMPLEAIF